jgi:hypothetical protein
MERGSRDNITVIVVDISLPAVSPSEYDLLERQESAGGLAYQRSGGGGGVLSSHTHGHRELVKSSSVAKNMLIKAVEGTSLNTRNNSCHSSLE